MNDIMSLGMHRMWKTKFVEMMQIKNNFKILDMAGGTGDVALEISRQHPAKKIDITIADCSSKMLTCCKEKLRNANAYCNLNYIWHTSVCPRALMQKNLNSEHAQTQNISLIIKKRKIDYLHFNILF